MSKLKNITYLLAWVFGLPLLFSFVSYLGGSSILVNGSPSYWPYFVIWFGAESALFVLGITIHSVYEILFEKGRFGANNKSDLT